MSKRASQVIILCEDKQHEVFVTRFLKKTCGYAIRDFRVPPYPAKGSGGSGEQFVRERYPKEIKAYRQRSSKSKTVLIVVIDADATSVPDRVAQLNKSCDDQEVGHREDGELIVHVIPKRNIGTWMAWLDRQAVNEEDDYPRYKFSKRESDMASHINDLVSICSENQLPNDTPDSLRKTCRDFNSFKARLP